MRKKDNSYFLRKLHSLSGIVPFGIFMTVHLLINFTAVGGQESYNHATDFMVNMLPFKFFLELFVIFLPLLFHAGYGLYIAFQGKNNVRQFGYYRNWKFYLQRVTAILAFLFIVWHVWETKIQIDFYGAEAGFVFMEQILSNNISLAFYIIGVLACIFHFANGVWTFLITWGITVSPESQRKSEYVAITLFIVLSIIAMRSLFAFL